MLSLRIASLERLTDEEIRGFDFFHPKDHEDYDSYNHPVYVQRRVGFTVIKYFEEYYKIPHYLVEDGKEEGEEVLTICTECFSETMYDSQQQEFYCPVCNTE